MHPLLTLMLSFTASTLAAPAPPASTALSRLSIRDTSSIDNSTFCSTHNPALTNTIGQMCSRDGGLIIGNNFTIAESDKVYKHSPHPASINIQGACESETTGPPEDVTNICMGIFWDLCRARIEHGRGVALNRGRNDCQIWFIAGWDDGNFSGFEWSGLKYLGMEDLSDPYAVAVPKMPDPTQDGGASATSSSSSLSVTTTWTTSSGSTAQCTTADYAGLISVILSVTAPASMPSAGVVVDHTWRWNYTWPNDSAATRTSRHSSAKTAAVNTLCHHSR